MSLWILPEFNGDETKYVSWRHAAHAAYKLFESYEGSSKHYQATAIIRNKITGRADATLASFNTTLNFHAIIARLDFSFADKRPIYLVEQDLSTLKQGRLTVESFYDVVERKLSLIINKVAMSNDGNSGLIDALNSKYRADALRVFISGLNKPLCDILFSAKPDNLLSALALAQELVSNQNRFAFANAFHSLDYRNFTTNYQAAASNLRQTAGASERPIPMDVDPSTSRYRANTNRGLGFGNKPNNPFSRSNTNTAVERKPFCRSWAEGHNHTVVKRLQTRTIPDVKVGIMEMLNMFPKTKIMVCDNEPSLKSETIKNYIKNGHGISQHEVPPYHSKSNGQVERFHSTLTEISRCIRNEGVSNNVVELILLATTKYNNSIHSVTDHKPIDVIYGKETSNKDIEERLRKKQTRDLTFHNRRNKCKTYEKGDVVYVKVNKRLGNKLPNIYAQKMVQEDLGTTVKIDG